MRQAWVRWQDEKMKIEGMGLGVLMQIEVSHTHKQSRVRVKCHLHSISLIIQIFNSISFISFVQGAKVPYSMYESMSTWTWTFVALV